MKSRRCFVSTLTVSAAMLFGAAALGADLPKEGTFSTTYSTFGTVKATPVGKQVELFAFDENGLSVGKGLLDHLTWHCWGLFEIVNGVAQAPALYCVATDPAGDQLAGTGAAEKHPQDAKSFGGSVTWTAGTGKYAGISGAFKFVCHPDFRAAAEGTYLLYCTQEGSYKLP